MDPLIDGSTSLSTLPAVTAGPGPVDPGAFAIFQPLYDAVLGGLNATVASDAAAMLGVVNQVAMAVCLIGLTFMALIELVDWNPHVGQSIFKYVWRASMVLGVLNTIGTYTEWVITPLQNLGDDLAAQLAGVPAGPPGHMFDVIMAHYSAATVKLIISMPWGSIKGALESLCFAFAALIGWVIAFGCVGTAFAVYLVVHIYLAGLLAVGPLFILCIAAGPLRNWFMGWLNAVCSQVLTLVFLGVTMSLMNTGENQILQQILNTADGSNFFSSVGHLFGGMVALGIGGVAAVCTRTLAVGVVGGVYAAASPYAATAKAMASGAGAMLIGGGTSGGGAADAAGEAVEAGAAAAPAAPAGASLAGRLSP